MVFKCLQSQQQHTKRKQAFQCTVCKYTLKVLIVDIFAVFVSIARRFALKRTHFAKLTANLSHTTILASDEQLISEVITVDIVEAGGPNIDEVLLVC